MKIVILGGSGLLGSFLKKSLSEEQKYILMTPTHSELNVADENEVILFFSKYQPDIVINLVALTDVELCQKNLQQAYELNMKVCQNLAGAKKKSAFYLIHVSTDHFYDSANANQVSKESDVVFRNVYALTKYAGEIPFHLDNQAVVLRTNFFGRSISKKPSFTDWLYTTQIQNNKIDLFTDIMFSPLHMSTIAMVVEKLFEERLSGVYNLGSREGLSKAAFSEYFLNNINSGYKNYKICESVLHAERAPRPRHMLMDSSALEKNLGIQLGTLKEELDKAIGEYK